MHLTENYLTYRLLASHFISSLNGGWITRRVANQGWAEHFAQVLRIHATRGRARHSLCERKANIRDSAATKNTDYYIGSVK